MIDPPEDPPDRLDPDAAALDELRRVFARAERPEGDAAGGADDPGADIADPDVDIADPDRDGADDSYALIIVDDDALDDGDALRPTPPPTAPRRWWRRRRPEASGEDLGAPVIGPDVAGEGLDGSVTIRIVDDELPDPVYLDADDVPTTAVIIDDGSPGEVASGGLPTYTRSTMDPKIRDRRVAVRRALGRRRLRWLVAVAATLLVVLVVVGVLTSPLFSIGADRVAVVGAVYTDRAALQEIIDDMDGMPTLTVDTESIERRIEMIPWVLDARVRVDFPRSAVIDIAERKPLITYQGLDGRYRVLDRQGRVLDVIDGQPIAYLLVETPGAPDLAPGQFATPGVAAAAETAQALTSSVRQRAARIDVAADGSELSLFVVGNAGDPASDTGSDPGSEDLIEVDFGAASDILVKLVRLETVLPTALEQGASRIDVSTAEVTID